MGAGAILLLVLALLLLVGFRWARSGSLPRLEVAGIDVGALEQDELDDRLAALAKRRGDERVEVVRGAIAASDPHAQTYTKSEAGYSIDVAATRERVLERGRQLNPLAALVDQVRASFATIAIEPVESFEPEELDRWVAGVAEEFEVTPRDGNLRFPGGSVEPVMPRPGAVVEEQILVEAARTSLMGSGARTLEVPLREVEPEMTRAEVDAAAREARALLSGPAVLLRAGNEVRLSRNDLSRMLGTRTSAGPDGTVLELRVRPKRLRAVAGDRLKTLERSPQDAGFELTGDVVRIVPGRAGFRLDDGEVADRLLEIARSEDRRGRAPGRREAPGFSTAEARSLEIDEQVSTFTTEHSCCEPRVANIHRIADMIDGTIVKPGERYSVNGAVGERTTEKGFVPAPAIFEGEYVAEVGGGISQFATTMYNAIFFGGYEFLDYKAHSYYISRYPAGREATLSWPAVDLAFRNDSDAGIYIDTSYSDTSITVTFYGTTDAEVESSAGDPHNYKEPPVRCEENRSLARGERRVIQEGKQGFDIVVHRVFEGPGREAERFFTRYLPEPRIVERRSCT